MLRGCGSTVGTLAGSDALAALTSIEDGSGGAADACRGVVTVLDATGALSTPRFDGLSGKTGAMGLGWPR